MQPTSLLGDVRGMARDFSLDNMPRGYVWDLVDYIPRRRGAKLDGRGPWSYLTTTPFAGVIWGGIHAPFRAGPRLLVAAGPNLYDVDIVTGAYTSVGTLFSSGVQNGVMLRDRVYFADGQALTRPKVVTNTSGTLAIATLTSGPPAKYLGVYRDRLIAAGDPANPSRVSFSPLETAGGPLGTWDALSYLDTSLAVSALWPMGSQILVFHPDGIEKIKGDIPPGANIDSDMRLDPFTPEFGCEDPGSVTAWQENVIWASAHGIMLSDGSTIRNISDQGGVGDAWRTLYAMKRAGTQVVAGVMLDMLFVTILTNWTFTTPAENRSFTWVCDLTTRSWWRFQNVDATAYIHRIVGAEDIWWGVDGINFPASTRNRLSQVSDLLFGNIDVDLRATPMEAMPDALDGNGAAVLPRVETAWQRMGPEGVKRMRHIYLSHLTQSDRTTNLDVLRVGYKTDPFAFTAYTELGDIPVTNFYRRRRVRLGKRGYGVMVKVEQVQPTYRTRLFDIAVDEWAQDGSKL